MATVDLWTRAAPARAVAGLDAALTAHPLTAASSHPNREYALLMAALYAGAGAPAKAEALLARVEAVADPAAWGRLGPERTRVEDRSRPGR